MAKLTFQQKRLIALKRQLYGGEKPHIYQSGKQAESVSSHSGNTFAKIAASTPVYTMQVEDVSYLKKDMTKILILSSLAISIQLILYFANQNHLINLKIF